MIKKFFNSFKRNNKTPDLKKISYIKHEISKIDDIDKQVEDAINETKRITKNIIKKLSNELSHTLDKLNSILDNLNDAVVFVNEEGIIKNNNKTFLELTNNNSYLNQNILELFENKNFLYESGFKTNKLIVNNKPINVEVSVLELNENIDDIKYILIIRLYDKQIESIFRMDEFKKFQFQFFDLIPHAVVWKDSNLNFKGFNSSAKELFSNIFDNPMILNNSLSNVIPIDDRNELTIKIINKKDNELLYNEKTNQLYKVTLYINDSPNEFIVYKSIVEEEDNTLGIMGIFINISNTDILNCSSLIDNDISEGIDIPMYHKNDKLEIINCNELYATTIIGKEKKYLLKKTIKELNLINNTVQHDFLQREDVSDITLISGKQKIYIENVILEDNLYKRKESFIHCKIGIYENGKFQGIIGYLIPKVSYILNK